MFTNSEAKIYVWDAENERWEVKKKVSGEVLFYVWETPKSYVWATVPTPTENEIKQVRGNFILQVIDEILTSEVKA